MEIIRKHYPGKPLLPSIGNNDVIVHNNVPCDEIISDTYYSELFDIWFPVGQEPKAFDRVEARKTFMQGGYYRYDFEDKPFSLISLNSVQFKSDNRCAHDRALP